jgi:hypothetical protein
MRLGDASISFTVRPEPSGNVSVGVLERTGKINIAVLLDAGDSAAA